MRKNLIPVLCKALDMREAEFKLFGNPQGFNDTPLLCKRINNCIFVWNADAERWLEFHGTFADALTGKDMINKMNKKENKMMDNTNSKLVGLTDALTLKFTQMLENHISEESNILLTTMLTLIAEHYGEVANFKNIYDEIKYKRDDLTVVRFGYSIVDPHKASLSDLFICITDSNGGTTSINFVADIDPSAYDLDDVQLCVIVSLAFAVVNTLTKYRERDEKLKSDRKQEQEKKEYKNYAEKTLKDVLEELFEAKTIASISVKLNNGNEVTINLSDRQEGHNTEE